MVERRETIRVLLADDHAMVRAGLKELLTATGDISVTGEAVDGHGVLEAVRAQSFDVAVLDLTMPGRSGIELIKLVKAEQPRLRVLVLSMHSEQQYAVRALIRFLHGQPFLLQPRGSLCGSR